MSEPKAETSKHAVRPDPARIIVPRKHGQVLVEPGYGELVEALRREVEHHQIRKAAREHFLEAARKWARETGVEGPGVDALAKKWVLTGHQVEFYHAGVWAKVIAAEELARRAGQVGGGVAFDVLVDHDVVDHLGFDVPERDGDRWKRVMAEWAAGTALPADSVRAPSETQFEEWDAELASRPLTQTDSLAMVLASLRGGLGGEYVKWMSAARRKFEQAMGLTVYHVPASLICEMPEWWHFLSQWVVNAHQWTRIYNEALAAYRKRQGIKNDHHPMPDLSYLKEGDSEVWELPFWIYRPGEARQRLFLRRRGGELWLRHGAEEVICPKNWADFPSDLRIRPRALTLTMFVRLFLADLFVHGIGGALYDQITDDLLAKLFGRNPPYACVSAAWLLPLGQPLENRDEVNELTSLRHHVLHNPQLAIDPFTAVKTDVAERIVERRELAGRIAESLATSRHESDAIRQRREWFDQLHAVNAELHAKAPNILRKLDTQIAECRRAQDQNKVLLWREYFFGLHTMESLRQLITKVRSV